MSSLSRPVTEFELKPGLVGSWASLRKLDAHLRAGSRVATEDDMVKGVPYTGQLVLLVKEVPIEAPTDEEATDVAETKTETKPAKKPVYKMKDGSKVHWVHADQVQKKQLKGYYLVAWNELVEGEDTEDVVTHDGHLLMAKSKGDK